jgi:uncharacterized protein YbjT (DUF2867 family)
MAKTYFVIGATGNTGQVVARELAAKGHTVRGLTRNPDKAPAIEGVQYVQGELGDVQFLKQQFKHVDAAYVMLPARMDASDFHGELRSKADTLTQAILEAGSSHVALLSSQGADFEHGNGPIASLNYFENKLEQIEGLNVCAIRAAYFMENLYGYIPLIKENGITGGPLPGDLKIPMIATADIGRYAAAQLDRLDFTGFQIHDLLGGGDYSQEAAAQLLGQAIAHPELPYMQFPPEDAKRGMMQMGMSEGAADAYIEMSTHDPARILAGTKRTPGNTTETSLEQFAQTFAQAFAYA